jgi:toxin ParE1/3/4
MPSGRLIRLQENPSRSARSRLSGRRVPEYDLEQIREVFSGQFRIIYHIKADQVDVLAVIHGAMNILRDEPE